MQLIFEPHGERLELLSLQYSFWLLDRLERRLDHIWDHVKEVRIVEEVLGARSCRVTLQAPEGDTLGVVVVPVQLKSRQQPESADTFNAMVEIMGHADEAAMAIGSAIMLRLDSNE